MTKRHHPPDWKTNPEILRAVNKPPTSQLNLDRLVAEGFVATRFNRERNKKEYRFDQYVRWLKSKRMFDSVREALREENGKTHGRYGNV